MSFLEFSLGFVFFSRFQKRDGSRVSYDLYVKIALPKTKHTATY